MKSFQLFVIGMCAASCVVDIIGHNWLFAGIMAACGAWNYYNYRNF